MRPFLLGLVLLLSPTFTRAASPLPALYDALVVVHVEGMNDVQLAAFAKHVGEERSITIEYSCVWAGILVLHLTRAQTADKADVTTLVTRHLREGGITGALAFEHVHVRAIGTGKC